MFLELSNVSKSYGRTVIIPELNLSVEKGEFVGVIGPNGAGKSTLFGVISGGLSCDKGSITFNGRSIEKLNSEQRCHIGIARTFQIPQPFNGLTVYENVLAAATFGSDISDHEAEALAVDSLQRTGLYPISNALASSLTLLQRKRLELARAIATKPDLLLLDEVAGGLTDGEMAELLELIVEINKSGVTVLWIEHLVHALVSVAKRLVVLSEGKLIADGLPKSVLEVAAVKETYMGADPSDEEVVPSAEQKGEDYVSR